MTSSDPTQATSAKQYQLAQSRLDRPGLAKQVARVQVGSKEGSRWAK